MVVLLVISSNVDEGEMPTARLKTGLIALDNGNTEKINGKYEEFISDIDRGNQRYRENNILMFGPLSEINGQLEV